MKYFYGALGVGRVGQLPTTCHLRVKIQFQFVNNRWKSLLTSDLIFVYRYDATAMMPLSVKFFIFILPQV